MIDNLLVVCEGNVCRSPMASALLARALPDSLVVSAGTHALAGRAADPLAVQLMAERGVDIGAHVAASLTPAHVRNAQLILTMTGTQRALLETAYPFSRGKVHRLGEHDRLDVVDPYRRGPLIFKLALAQIEQSVLRWLDAIARLRH